MVRSLRDASPSCKAHSSGVGSTELLGEGELVGSAVGLTPAGVGVGVGSGVGDGVAEGAGSAVVDGEAESAGVSPGWDGEDAGWGAVDGDGEVASAPSPALLRLTAPRDRAR